MAHTVEDEARPAAWLAFLRACPEAALGSGLELPAGARLSRDAAARQAAGAALGDWQRELAREARTAAEEREAQLLHGYRELLEHLAAQPGVASTDPDPLWRLWRVLLDQAALGPAPGLRWLRELPAVLDEHRRVPLAPRAILLDQARLQAARAPRTLEAVVEQLRAAGAGAELETAARAAAEALQQHAAWLHELTPVPPPVLDEAACDALCRLRRMPYAVAELRELLDLELREWEVERARRARRLDRSASVDAVLARARAAQPLTVDEGLAALRSALAAVHAHALEHRLIEPGGLASVDLVEVPPSLQGAVPLPWLRPGVERIALWLASPDAAAPLAGLAAPERSLLVACHGVPGRAWLAWRARGRTTPVRGGLPDDVWPFGYTGWAADLSEGWGLYAAEMLREAGWDGSPELALLLTEHARTACLAARLDLDLARGALDDAAAVARAARELRLDGALAEAQVAMWVRRPGAAVAAVVGALRLFELRRSSKVQWGAGHTPASFHASVHAAGLVPLDEVEQCLAETPVREPR